MKVLEIGGLWQCYKYAYKWFQLDLLENRIENNFYFCSVNEDTNLGRYSCISVVRIFKMQQYKKKNQENQDVPVLLYLLPDKY